jgi:hypothetical protein
MNLKKCSLLPIEYHMDSLPCCFELRITGFEKHHNPASYFTLAPEHRDCEKWYNEFIDKIIYNSGKKFLPIVRIGDGEFLLLLGDVPQDFRFSLIEKIKLKLVKIKWQFLLKGGISAYTVGHYHSGNYTFKECINARNELPQIIGDLSRKGILAPMTMFKVPTEPFAERYFSYFDRWLKKHSIIFTNDNYCPQYFIYSALTGSRRSELLLGRRILIINGAQEEKKQKIINGLIKEGVADVQWLHISLERSMFDIIDVTPYIGKVDLAIVGAGLGKFHIFAQLEELNVPCIDAGYIFEVWADNKNKFKRDFCASDEDWFSQNKISKARN